MFHDGPAGFARLAPGFPSAPRLRSPRGLRTAPMPERLPRAGVVGHCEGAGPEERDLYMLQSFRGDCWTRGVVNERGAGRDPDCVLRDMIAGLAASPERSPQDIRASVDALADRG